MRKILAIDYGLKRTGLAVTDDLGMMAFGLQTIDTAEAVSFLKKYIPDNHISTVVVGLPTKMNGLPSEIEPAIAVFIEKLKTAIPKIEIHRQDERFTSIIAQRAIREAGLSKKKRADKKLVDEVSATLILQSFLDRKYK